MTLALMGPTLFACGSTEIVEDPCLIETLPISGGADAPTITDVGLELQPGEGVIIVATATDPEGSENLRDVQQSIGVFPDLQCEGVPLTLSDDLVGSGIEETFGTAVSSSDNAALYSAIEAESGWPVQLDFSDVDGNRTSGRVRARIIR